MNSVLIGVHINFFIFMSNAMSFVGNIGLPENVFGSPGMSTRI
jgi:hypothetical protein